MGKLASGTSVFPKTARRNLLSLAEKIEEGSHKPHVSVERHRRSGSSLKAQSLESSVEYFQQAKEYTQRPTAGKKRDVYGNVRVSCTVPAKNLHTGEDKQKNSGGGDHAALLQEILALGGTEDDLDLVAGAISGEDDIEGELAWPTMVDGKFTKELSKFIAELGLEENVNAESAEANLEDGKSDTGGRDLLESLPTREGTVKRLSASASKGNSKPEKLTKDPSHLMFEARPDWHAAVLPSLPAPDIPDTVPFKESITELKKYAFSLLDADGNLYNSKYLSSTTSHRFLSTIMSSGTLSDKVSALTLVVQESPVHTTKSFESLLTLAKKRSRSQAVTALGAIKDLLGAGAVLPADRRLRQFSSQPGLLGALQRDTVKNWKQGCPLPESITKAHMISWAYEDWLKDAYFDMIRVLEVWCNDEVEFARSRAVTYVFELLCEKPEQESNLLRLLVNKLGDPDRKIASRTSYLILQLQTAHPLMKPIIIRAVENEVLLRPSQSSHARYYAINTLNQTILSGKEEETACKLLDIYFNLFVALLRTSVCKANTGSPVNYKGQIQGDGAKMSKKAKAKAAREEAATQSSKETTEKLVSAVLTGVNRALPFAKSDDATLETHMDVLFKITHSSNFNTSIQALILIQQLMSSKNIAMDRFYRTLYESLLDPRLTSSSKHAMFLNLLFKALKSDPNVKRVKAFVKRLVQVITLHQPPFICGVLYLLRELGATFPGLGSLLRDPEGFDEGDEVFLDVPEGTTRLPFQAPSSRGSPTFENSEIHDKIRLTRYNGRKRGPEHSNADKSCLWELLPFTAHFHPSVSIFAKHLLDGSEMPAKPVLASHTLIHFLDRFVYRNAKVAVGGLRGSSIMQPLAGGDSKGVIISTRLAQRGHEYLNSESFWRKNVDDVAVDDVFFHNYFTQIGKGKQISGKNDKSIKRRDVKSDDGGNGNEDEIWQALVESQPEIEDYYEDNSDIEMLDLDGLSDGLPDANDSGIESENGEVADPREFDGVSMYSEQEGESDMGKPDDKELLAWQSRDSPATQKESRSKRRRVKNLPTFASIEEYVEMLSGDEDEEM